MTQKQILIVEDNELNRAMLSEIWSDSYKVVEAENGKDALDILEQNRDDIHLILLDNYDARYGWIYFFGHD